MTYIQYIQQSWREEKERNKKKLYQLHNTESGARYEIPTEVVLKIRVFCDFRLKQLNLLCEQTDGPTCGTSCY